MSRLQESPIADLRMRYGLEVFVETGCHTGEGLQYARRHGFADRFSCDIDPRAVERCRDLGTVSFQESTSFLQELLPVIAGRPTAFWLDAHFPEDYGLTGSPFPLLEELSILTHKAGIARDVILCDDLRVLADPANPLFDPGLPERYHIHHRLETLYALFPQHHHAICPAGTGILILEPA